MIKKLLALLSRSERNNIKVLMGMILLMSFLDVLGVASILPFTTVLLNPELIQSNNILYSAFTFSHQIGIHTVEQFLFILGVMVFVVLFISLAFKALTIYLQNRIILMLEYSIGKRFVEGYLHQPYSWFLSRNSADLGKNILSEIQIVINSGMLPMITLIAQSTVTIALLIMLLVIDPLLAISVILFLILAYGIIFTLVNNWLKRLGKERSQANKDRFNIISETFSAAKEVKVGGLEETCVQRFSKPAEIYARGQTTARIIGLMPRFALEAIVFGGMLLLILFLMTQKGSFTSAIPIIALYAFTGYRLMPALQQIYAAFTQLRFVRSAVENLYKDLSSLKISRKKPSLISPLKFKECIHLESVSYCYPKAISPVLKAIDIKVYANNRVGIVGATGSGKTTTVDVILGLLKPKEGRLIVDSQPITNENLYQWQQAIGYVPQNIYLVDDTVAANIAFGKYSKDMDQDAIEFAARNANIHEFITKELPQGYATKVGERGVRLSGGQRQRIGIARALFQKPQVLILDEATSALDNLTEQLVMEKINNLGYDITIIMIAHRLSTLQNCDQIYFMEQGEVKASGTYDQLTKSNQKFAAMAKIV
jgi:ABC-type bacteriocin/lantibiotic exporter with double-glycine peptidase domain